MSIRANSLQSVALDGVYFTALMGLAAAMSATVAWGADPRTVAAGDVAADRRLMDDHIDNQPNADANLPSGDPTESPAAKRQAMMLGMTLVERHEGFIHVADVAATSPAWDAGIRRGDRLLSIDGIKPRSLSKWVEDVGGVLKDTPDGHAVSTDVERDGEKLALRIRVPVSKAAEVRDARQEEQALAQMAANQQQQMPRGQQGMQPIASANETDGGGYGPGYGGYGVGGWGLGGFFDDEEPSSAGGNTADDRLANRAIAQLMAVNTVTGGAGSQAGRLQNGQSTGAQSTGGQVGLAAFQNTQRGVSAVVVVRGLAQGTYRVGIGQGDALASGFGSDAAGNGAIEANSDVNGAQEQLGRGSQTFNSRNMNRRDLNRGSGGQRDRVVPEPLQNNGRGLGQPPMNPAAPAGGAAGSADGASLANPHHAGILAQQMETQPMQGTQNGNSGVAAGTFPDDQTGSNNPTEQNNNTGVAPGTFGNNEIGAGNASRTGSDINPTMPNNNVRPTPLGILRVGPDGSGRVENLLEGVQVRNLAGMSVTVYSEMAQAGGLTATSPQGFANPDQSRNLNQQQQQNNVTAMRGRQNATARMAGGAMQTNQLPGALNGGSTQGIVATGVIQIMEGNTPGLAQQEGSLFPSDQRNVDQSTQDQRNRRQFSTPQQDFNPSTPQ